MKKLLFVSVIVLVLSLSFSFAASKFSDVNGSKYETAVTSLNGKGVIDGFTDGSFRPQNSVTRAQLCKLLVEALGLKKANNVALSQFKDVDSSQWFYDYVKIAVDNAVIVGYQDGTFKPNNDVNYNELITMIIRAMGKEKVMTDKTWPSAYVAYASYYGLLSNVTYNDGSNPAIRGEVSIALYNMLNRMEEEATKQETFKVMYGFVESVSTKNKVDYVKIDGVTYPVSYRSKSFTEDTYAVFEKSNLTDEVTLGAYYGVKDLDGNADIVTYVKGKQGAQEVQLNDNSKYYDYFTKSNISKYSSYGICVINVQPNNKDVLEVTKHTNKSTIEDIKFTEGDRIVEDSKVKVFLVFHGLEADDKVSKGKYTAAVEYATISYKWDGDHPSGASLPKTEYVEIGEKYHVKYPQLKGYEFYVTNLSTESFTVTKDVTIYIGTVDFDNDYYTISYGWDGDHPSKAKLPSSETVKYGTTYHVKYPQLKGYEFYVTNLPTESFKVTSDFVIRIATVDFDDGGSAGSNIPLVDNFEKIENTVRHICPGRLIDLNDYFMSIDITDIDNVKAINDSKVKVTVTFDAYLDSDCDPDEAEYLRTDGYYDEDDHCLKELTEAFLLTDDGSDTCSVSFTQKNY